MSWRSSSADTLNGQQRCVLMICCLRLAFTLHVLHSAVSVEDLSKTAFEIGDSLFIFHKMFAMRDQTTMRLPILLPITALLVAKSHAYCNWNGCNGVVQGGEWCNESTDRCETGCQVRFVETIPA